MDLKNTAIRAAKKAGEVLVDLSKKEIKYGMKNERDVLAEADIKSEEIIIQEITKSFPEHSIFSEEEGKIAKSSDYRWIIDPLDGTINFIKGIEEYCISMAFEHKEELVFGLIYQPHLNKLYLAEKGKGAFLNNKRLSVSSETELVNMLLAVDNTSNMQVRIKNYQILSKMCKKVRGVRIFGSASLHLARIAAGEIDIYYKAGSPHYWDCAPGALLVKEAGGMATDFNGNEVTESFTTFLASNGKKHKELLENFQSFGDLRS